MPGNRKVDRASSFFLPNMSQSGRRRVLGASSEKRILLKPRRNAFQKRDETMRHSLITNDPRKLIYAIIMAIASIFASSAHGQFPSAFGGSNPGNTDGPVPQIGGQVPGGMPGMMPAPPANAGGNPFAQAPGNPVVGVWLAAVQNGPVSLQARLELKPNGEFQLEMVVDQGGSKSQVQTSGRYQIQGNVMVTESGGVIERLPVQFDGRRLVIDIPSEGIRFGFARNPQESFVQPLPQQNVGGYGQGPYGG
jgi:hypothetical protein